MFNMEMPTYFDAAARVVVIGDVHGDLARLTECLYATNVLNKNGEWIADPPNTVVVQLGDQIDSRNRGAVSEWERVADTEVMLFMDRIDNVARMKGGRVISLIGNHEIMNVIGDFTYVSEHSGKDLILRQQRFQAGGPFSTILAKRCVVAKVGSLLFVHGGILPFHLMMVNGNLHRMNELTRKMLRGEPMDVNEVALLSEVVTGERGILWTRSYMEVINMPETLHDMLNAVLGNTGCKMVCVGHNTVHTITNVAGGRLWFVDAGLSRAYGTDTYQVLEIFNDGAEFRIVEIKK
jgi:hypothetical protein